MRLQVLSFHAGTGWSEPLDASLDSDQTLVLAFAAPQFGQEPGPLEELRQRLPRAQLLGCSTSGEIHGTKVNDHSVSVAVVQFARSTVRSASAVVGTSADSYLVGAQIGRSLAGPDLRAVMLLADGLSVNGSELVRGINEVVGGRAVVTGGLAGDGSAFKRTWVAHNGAPQSGIVAGVGLYGEHLRVGHGSKGGWDIFGPERLVTRSEGNVLYELDGKPALELYKEYLGDRASGLPATALLFPLALRETGASDKRLVRTVLAVDDTRQSMTFAGDIPQGALAQLMRANFDRLVQGASDAALMARGTVQGAGPSLSVAISCVGRRLVLGERVEEETEATVDVLPPGARQVGFYSYGEISPHTDGTCDLHNQTMTLTTIAEA